MPDRPSRRGSSRPSPDKPASDSPAPDDRSDGAESTRDTLLYAAWSAAWWLVAHAPERLVSGAFDLAADLAWRRRGRGVRRLEANLARVLATGDRPADPAEVRRVSRAGMRSYLRYWREAFQLHRLSPERIRGMVRTYGEDTFFKALDGGRGVIAVLPHQANWDLAGAWLQGTGRSLTTVAERLRPERLFERFVRYREALGMEVLPHSGGDDPFGVLADRLRDGGLVCLVADRDLSARGISVDFFGAPARMPAGPAALAIRTGALLVPVGMWYDGPAMHLRFGAPIDPADIGRGADSTADRPPDRPRASRTVVALTQRVADEFADSIAAHPEDWHMLQRVWEADLG